MGAVSTKKAASHGERRTGPSHASCGPADEETADQPTCRAQPATEPLQSTARRSTARVSIDLAKNSERTICAANKQRSLKGQYEASRRDIVGGLQCDSDFIIVSVDKSLMTVLKFGDTDTGLVGRSITSLMSPLVSRIHEELFARLKNMEPGKLESLKSKLEYNMSNCRDFVIFDAENEPQVCGISIFLESDLTSRVEFSKSNRDLLHAVPLGFGVYINQPPSLHFMDFNDVIIIMLDVSAAYQHCSDKSPEHAACFCHRIFNLSHNVILREVFPYAYIHEAIGDTIMLLVNADFMVRWTKGSTGIALTAASSMQQELDNMLQSISPSFHARAGISMGTISGGVVDGRTFRVFGHPVHLSQRLMAKCHPGKIACSKEFMSAFKEQNPFPNATPVVEDQSADLKGFGQMDFSLLLSSSIAQPLNLARPSMETRRR